MSLLFVLYTAAAAAPAGMTHVGTISPRDSGAASEINVWEDLKMKPSNGAAGAISFWSADNSTLLKSLSKRDVDAGQRNATPTGSNASCCGQGFKINDLVQTGPDLLGVKLLSHGGDPVEADVETALPGFIAAHGQVAAFVGSRRGPAYALDRTGAPSLDVGIRHPFLGSQMWSGLNLSDPATGLPVAGCPNPCRAGVVGGYLPVLRYTFDEIVRPTHGACCVEQCYENETQSDIKWELTVLGEVAPPSAVHQTAWWRYLRYRKSTGELLTTVTIENNAAYPSTVFDSPALLSAFYAELLKTSNTYDALFGVKNSRKSGSKSGQPLLFADVGVATPAHASPAATDAKPLVVTASDAAAIRIIDQSKHSLIREWIARQDSVWGRYGVQPDGYGGSESDGFQENVNSGATAALAWGFLGTARGILSTYWAHIVRDDGGIKYRGAMLPGYGRMLTILCQYVATADDASILSDKKIGGHVDAVVAMIKRKIAAGKKQPATHIAHGLPLGCDEADACGEYSTYTATDADLPYFSAAMEVWRGLRDLGRVYTQQPSLKKKAEGAQLVALAAQLSADISTSWARSLKLSPGNCPPYVAGAGANRSLPLNNCTRVEGLVPQYHADQANDNARRIAGFIRVSEPWRSYAEMAHSGFLSDADTAKVYKYQQQHDSLMRLGVGGGVNVPNAMFGHTAYGLASGLVGASMAEEYLLFLYAQSHHACTKGTWTFWEKVLIDRRKSICCFAAPSQVTLPSALRWGLAFEDEAKGLLALARTLPRSWFSAQDAFLNVKDAPVSRQLLGSGAVSYSLRRHASAPKMLLISVDLGGGGGTQAKPGPALKTLTLRLRMPASLGGTIKAVSSGTGEDWSRRLKADVLTLVGAAEVPLAAELTGIKVVFA